MGTKPSRREPEPERDRPAPEPPRAAQPNFHPLAIPAFINGRWVIIGWGC